MPRGDGNARGMDRMTKTPTKDKSNEPPAPGKWVEWRQDPDGSWYRFEDLAELRRDIWRRLDDLGMDFHEAAEIENDESLDEVGFILPALRDANVRKAAIQAAHAYFRERNPGWKLPGIGREGNLLHGVIASALEREDPPDRIAELIADAILNFRKLRVRLDPEKYRPPSDPERAATIALLRAALTPAVVYPDTGTGRRALAARLARSALRALGDVRPSDVIR